MLYFTHIIRLSMNTWERIKQLYLTKQKPPDPAPQTFLVQPAPAASEVEKPTSFLVTQPTPPSTFTAPPPKPVAPVVPRFTVAKPKSPRMRLMPLRKLAYILILLNVGIALFFTSNSMQFNVALYLYMGASTILMAHYLHISG
jgi:hypothetical protein